MLADGLPHRIRRRAQQVPVVPRVAHLRKQRPAPLVRRALCQEPTRAAAALRASQRDHAPSRLSRVHHSGDLRMALWRQLPAWGATHVLLLTIHR